MSRIVPAHPPSPLELESVLAADPALAALARAGAGGGRSPEPERLGKAEDGYHRWRVPVSGRRGALYAGPLPGRRSSDGAAGHLAALRAAGTSRLVCLVPLADLRGSPALSEYARAARAAFGDGAHFVEIPDFGLPGRLDRFEEVLGAVDVGLRAGETVQVHCEAGCGRTGLFVACLLVRQGMTPADAIRHFLRYRGCGPETPLQVAFVAWYAGA